MKDINKPIQINNTQVLPFLDICTLSYINTDIINFLINYGVDPNNMIEDVLKQLFISRVSNLDIFKFLITINDKINISELKLWEHLCKNPNVNLEQIKMLYKYDNNMNFVIPNTIFSRIYYDTPL